MPPAKVALVKSESTSTTRPAIPNGIVRSHSPTATASGELRPTVPPLLRSVGPSSSSNLQREPGTSFQGKTPPITGEASFRGWVSVDGLVSGQLGANGGGLSIKQRSLNANGERAPELNGEIRFKEMLRVNGHVAGRIVSEKGTLIVATEARVDADIAAAAVVISGEVNGNVIGHNRVELSAGSVVRGNISTTSLAIKPGAFFDGDCYVIQNKTERES